MREIHGVDDAFVGGYQRSVEIIDCDSDCMISIFAGDIHHATVVLSVEQARFIAAQLIASADRAENVKS
jgi:hypothetical protein